MRGKRAGEFSVTELFRLWASGMSQADICESLGIRRGTFWAIKQRYKLPSRECDRLRAIEFLEPGDPTPAEIAERAAIERSKWSPEEEAKRVVCLARRPVELRRYSFDHQNYAFSGVDS